MKKIAFFLIFSIVISIFCSCKKENIVASDIEFAADKEFFPLKTNSTLIYKVTAITINKPSNFYDTSTYFLKERIDIQFIDNENDTAYRIERSKRYTTDEKWQISDIWEAKLTNNTAEKVEENQRLIKMVFPIKKDFTWNINRKNDLPAKNVTINSINDNYIFNNQQLDSCVNVRWNNSDSIINLQVKNEKYARNIGLVYKDSINVYSDEVIIGVPILQRVTKGTIYYQELIAIE